MTVITLLMEDIMFTFSFDGAADITLVREVAEATLELYLRDETETDFRWVIDKIVKQRIATIEDAIVVEDALFKAGCGLCVPEKANMGVWLPTMDAQGNLFDHRWNGIREERTRIGLVDLVRDVIRHHVYVVVTSWENNKAWEICHERARAKEEAATTTR